MISRERVSLVLTLSWTGELESAWTGIYRDNELLAELRHDVGPFDTPESLAKDWRDLVVSDFPILSDSETF